jgi:hypothetical protein
MIKKVIPIISGSTGSTQLFNFNIGLTAKAKDWGWFDTVEPMTSIITTGGTLITGTSSSRLTELRKYTVSGTLSDMYFTSTSSTQDGLNVSLSMSGMTYTYYLGGLTYVDQIVNSATTTTFSYYSYGLNDPTNFVNGRLIKDESKQNVIENPFVNSDVFIIRQELPVFEQSVRLRGINTLNEIIAYAGGNYFTIYENT